jgi:hypothetical protein
MEWGEPLSRGRKGQDHSAQRLINIRVGGEPRDPANLPPSASLDRPTMSINIEALKRFTASTRNGIEWNGEPSGASRHVTIVIRSPQTYDSIGWQLMKEAMARHCVVVACALTAAGRRPIVIRSATRPIPAKRSSFSMILSRRTPFGGAYGRTQPRRGTLGMQCILVPPD